MHSTRTDASVHLPHVNIQTVWRDQQVCQRASVPSCHRAIIPSSHHPIIALSHRPIISSSHHPVFLSSLHPIICGTTNAIGTTSCPVGNSNGYRLGRRSAHPEAQIGATCRNTPFRHASWRHAPSHSHAHLHVSLSRQWTVEPGGCASDAAGLRRHRADMLAACAVEGKRQRLRAIRREQSRAGQLEDRRTVIAPSRRHRDHRGHTCH